MYWGLGGNMLNIKREPLAIINTVTTLITAAIMLLVAFGLPMTKEQAGALITFIGAVAALAATLVVRTRVTPVADPKNNDNHPLKPA